MTERMHIGFGGRSIVVEVDGDSMKITVDGQPCVDVRSAPPKKPVADRVTSRERAAGKFIDQANPLIGPPLSTAQQALWRTRVNDMASFIRSGHAFGKVKHRDELLRELCAAVANTASSNARDAAHAGRARSKSLPWYAPPLGLSAWPVTASALKDAYRKRVLAVHPDRGGTQAAFVELQKAHDAAKAALGVS